MTILLIIIACNACLFSYLFIGLSVTKLFKGKITDINTSYVSLYHEADETSYVERKVNQSSLSSDLNAMTWLWPFYSFHVLNLHRAHSLVQQLDAEEVRLRERFLKDQQIKLTRQLDRQRKELHKTLQNQKSAEVISDNPLDLPAAEMQRRYLAKRAAESVPDYEVLANSARRTYPTRADNPLW